jgi:hypothetical protein
MASEDRPNYKIAIAEIFPEISGEHLRPQLIAAIKTSPLAVEQVLLSAKIDIIIAHLKMDGQKAKIARFDHQFRIYRCKRANRRSLPLHQRHQAANLSNLKEISCSPKLPDSAIACRSLCRSNLFTYFNFASFTIKKPSISCSWGRTLIQPRSQTK